MSSNNLFFRLLSQRQDVITVILFVISAACFTLFYYKTETTVKQMEFLLKLSSARSDFLSLSASTFYNVDNRKKNEKLKDSQLQDLYLSYSNYINLLHSFSIPERLKDNEETASNELFNRVINARHGDADLMILSQNTPNFKAIIEESLEKIKYTFHWQLILLILIPFLIAVIRTLHGLYYIDIFDKISIKIHGHNIH